MRFLMWMILTLPTTAVGSSVQRYDFFPLPQQEHETEQTDAAATSNENEGIPNSQGDTNDDAPSCDLQCLNSGACVLDDQGNASCSCDKGYSGVRCENEGEVCGISFCHHGSKCLEIKLADGAKTHICDCTPAYTSDTFYSGEFCQYPSTEFCTGPDDPNGRQFCVNNGKCPTQSHFPCICPEGFSGPRCAFQLGVDGMDYRECELECLHGGTCHKGLKPSQKHLDMYLSEKEQQAHHNYEHCVCPTGWYGVRCEYQVEECEEGKHLCFHGSTCVSDGEDEFSCDCMSSNVNTAGLFCENIASSECDGWKDNGNGHRGFCTNGGVCSVDENGYATCSCPSGYEGHHCEYRMSLNDVNPYKTKEANQTKRIVFGVFGGVFGGLAVLYAIFLLLKYHPGDQREKNPIENEATPQDPNEPQTSGVYSVELL